MLQEYSVFFYSKTNYAPFNGNKNFQPISKKNSNPSF